MKEKDTPTVTLPSGSDEPAPSPRKCTDPAILYFSLQPDNDTAARQRFKFFEKRKVRRPVSVTSALRNAIPKALLLDSQHLDEIETFGTKADSKPVNGVPATFERFPDLPVEVLLYIPFNFDAPCLNITDGAMLTLKSCIAPTQDLELCTGRSTHRQDRFQDQPEICTWRTQYSRDSEPQGDRHSVSVSSFISFQFVTNL